jgi:hypothetical protein
MTLLSSARLGWFRCCARARLIRAFSVLLVCSCVLAQQPNRTPTTVVMARNVKRSEPGWRYMGGWCTCPPTVPGQVWRDNATWERRDKLGLRQFVDVEIVKAASSDEAAEWMRRYGGGGGAKSSSCGVETYPLGDEGVLLTCARSFKSQLNYRKGPFLIRVRGDSQTLVERFAKYALHVVSAT